MCRAFDSSWAAALTATVALALLLASASSCHFITVSSSNGAVLSSSSSSFGVYCPSSGDANGTNSDLHGDGMWIMSTVAMTLALVGGCASTAVAWDLCLFAATVTQERLWTIVSVTAAISAVLCVPVFLLFQSNVCLHSVSSSCELDSGAVLLIFSLVGWIVVTILTQCLEPTSLRREHHEQQQQEQQQQLKVDRTMLEDEEDGLLASIRLEQQQQQQQQQEQDDSIPELMGTLVEPALVADEHKYDEDHEEDEEKAVADHTTETSAAPVVGKISSSSFSPSSYYYTRGAAALVTPSKSSPMLSPAVADTASATTRESPVRLLEMTPTDRDNDQRIDDENSATMGDNKTSIGPQKYDRPCPEGVAFAPEDEEDNDDDLGSLEPTVVEVTGDDSLLDSDIAMDGQVSTTRQPLLPRDAFHSSETFGGVSSKKAAIGEVMQKVMTAPVDLGLAVLSRAKENRRRRILKGYKLMDDSNIESSYPLTPPLEILTLNIARESNYTGNEVNYLSTQQEQALIDEWNAMRLNGSIAAETFSDEPEPHLDFSDDDSGGGDGNRNNRSLESDEENEDDEDDMDGEGEPIRLQTIDGVRGPVNRPDAFTRKKKRRSRRSRRIPTGRSVVSASSLLTSAIEEETAEDLEISDHESGVAAKAALNPVPLTRSRSAPSLAGFGRLTTDVGNVYEDIHMTGINSFHTAEIFRRSDESSSTTSSRGKKSIGRGSSGLGTLGWKRKIPPSSSSVPDQGTATTTQAVTKKVPIFRKERALRAGIHHAQSYISDPSSGEESKSASSAPSMRSRKARLARLKRLQGLPLTKTQGYGGRPNRNESHVRVGVAVQSTGSGRSGGSTVSGNSKSFDSGNYLIDLMDVQLAELNRPEGAHKGPDEESL